MQEEAAKEGATREAEVAGLTRGPAQEGDKVAGRGRTRTLGPCGARGPAGVPETAAQVGLAPERLRGTWTKAMAMHTAELPKECEQAKSVR